MADITVSLGAVRIWSFAVIFGLVLLWLLGGFLSLLRLSKFAQKKSWQSVLNRVLLMAVLVAACFGAIFAWAHFISAEYPVWYDAVFLGLVSLSMLVIVFGLMRVSLSYPRILFILGWITIVGSICFWYLIQVFLLLTICGKFGCFGNLADLLQYDNGGEDSQATREGILELHSCRLAVRIPNPHPPRLLAAAFCERYEESCVSLENSLILDIESINFLIPENACKLE
ncbi:MAG: hypothetical protein PHO48_03870 [Candidatus Gracilibacteria bacterium]|nr:hypothetical protein [Candidatus Gracilibacteria bacterium]MDD5179574.1 hypothetical protein [Candidatus Gracilibacteria bacterium]